MLKSNLMADLSVKLGFCCKVLEELNFVANFCIKQRQEQTFRHTNVCGVFKSVCLMIPISVFCCWWWWFLLLFVFVVVFCLFVGFFWLVF